MSDERNGARYAIARKPVIGWMQGMERPDVEALRATAVWLRQVNWQWFITLTFPWNVRHETAMAYYRSWVDSVERELRTRVCYVIGMERKGGPYGMEVPWHFHGLVTALRPIPHDLLVDRWETLVWKDRYQKDGLDASVANRRDTGEAASVPALIESYAGHRLGPEYCLKRMNACDGEWAFNWLGYFLPNQRMTHTPNGRTIRQRRRFKQQAKMLQKMANPELLPAQSPNNGGSQKVEQRNEAKVA